MKYKANFIDKGWADESFKWTAVKYFQDNWDVNAEDFASMFDKALNAPKVYLGLLASANNFPVGMMSSFAKAAPEEVRAMFIELFDESKDVVDRILSFKKKSDDLLEKYGEGAKQHYQYENAISTYLWLRFPDKYYIYKYSEAKSVAEVINADMKIKKGAYAANLRNFLALYDALCDKLKADDELVKLLRDRIEDGHYPEATILLPVLQCLHQQNTD